MLVRYDSVDHQGQTRRQRNIRFEAENETPKVKVPDEGLYLWHWFFDLSGVRTDRDKQIPFTEIAAWSRLSGINLEPVEFEILIAMDRTFVQALSAELAHNQERQRVRDEAQSKVRR